MRHVDRLDFCYPESYCVEISNNFSEFSSLASESNQSIDQSKQSKKSFHTRETEIGNYN